MGGMHVLGNYMNCTYHAMAGHVIVKYRNAPTMLLYSVGPAINSSPKRVRAVRVTIGVQTSLIACMKMKFEKEVRNVFVLR